MCDVGVFCLGGSLTNRSSFQVVEMYCRRCWRSSLVTTALDNLMTRDKADHRPTGSVLTPWPCPARVLQLLGRNIPNEAWWCFLSSSTAHLRRIKIKTSTCGKKRSRDDGEENEDDEEEQKGGEKATKKLLASLPSGLRVVTNFGLVDICPERSGKHNAAEYLAKNRFQVSLENCASMGDDDNDIALVRLQGRRFHHFFVWSGNQKCCACANVPSLTGTNITCFALSRINKSNMT